MPSQFAVGLRACCVAVVLVLAMAHAAEQKSSLIGATRDQVLERLGEPRGILTVGNREVITFERQRVTLREGVVIDVEPLAAEPGQRPAPAPPPPAAETTAPPAGGAQPAPAPPARAPATPTEPGAPAESRTAAPTTPSGTEGQFSIKSVRTPGSSRPTPKEPPKQEPTAPATAVPPSTSATAQAEQAARAAAPEETQVAPTATRSPGPTPAPATGGTTALPAAAGASAGEPAPDSPQAAKAAAEEAAAKSEEDARAKARAKAPIRRPTADELMEDPPLFTTKRILLGAAIIAVGLGFVLWLRRQRQLELAATTVSHSSLASSTATGSGAQFAPELLAKLEWKRFEELVALYYSKTGVVATRTKTGPASPVHIKISWKGEPRPFAYVQCIPHPAGLIEPRPLNDLVAALAAEDIRRGYVVTAGKFSVNARDMAEEKHLTLLPGEIFLEKLNALPDAARSEIMQEITKGDYQTPSCPKCDAKMVRSETGVWRCAQHPEMTVPNTP